MANPVYESIKQAGRLPSPVGVALEVLRLTEDPESSAKDFGNALEKDPALSARILRAANSPLYGLSRRVASVSHAVTLLGRREVSRLSLCFSLVSQHRHGRCEGFNYELFWSDSIGRATAARALAGYLHDPSADEIFTAALLSGIGRLAFATVFPARYTSLLAGCPADQLEALAAAEQTEFGMDHCFLAAEMVRDWGIPDTLASAIQWQLNPDAEDGSFGDRARIFASFIALAAQVSVVMTGIKRIPDVWMRCVMQANCLGIPPDVFRERFDLIREQWREAGSILTIVTQPVPTAAELTSAAERIIATLESSEKACPASMQEVEQTRA